MYFVTRCSLIVVLTVLLMLLSLVPSVQAIDFGVGGDSPQSDNARMPFRIKMTGVINPEAAEGGRIVKLGIIDFNETYPFEIVKVEALDNPHVTDRAILQQVGKYAVDFDLIGPRELLSKVGQANPGTPLTMVGFFTQRKRKLQLESVDVVGLQEAPHAEE